MTAVQNQKSGGLVWIGSSCALITYATLGFLEFGIPGVEEIVRFIDSAVGPYIYVAAFLAILIEGLYIVGNLFPGSTFIILTAVLSQLVGITVFIGTIVAIFIGWCLAGAINIFVASRYHTIRHHEEHTTKIVKDNLAMTWFPSFRASYEVAQVSEGFSPVAVFISSVRVKFITSLVAGVGALSIPFFIDVSELSNDEGFASVLVIAAITMGVGVRKLYQAKTARKTMVGD